MDDRTVQLDVTEAPTELLESGQDDRSRGSGSMVSQFRVSWFSALSTKFFLAAALLLVLTLGTAVAVATWRANVVADRTIRESLTTVPTMFRAWRTDLEQRLKTQVRSLAEEPGTKALYAPEVSHETRVVWAEDQTGLMGARTVFLFDDDSRVIARSDRPDGRGLGRPFGAVKWVSDPLFQRRDSCAAIVDRKSLALVASTAVVAGEGEESRVDGVLAMSFPLSAAEVAALHGITRGEVAFLTNMARRDEPPRAEVAATSAGMDGSALVEQLEASPGVLDRLLGEGQQVGPLDSTLGGETRIMAAVPILSASGEPLGAFVVTRSRREETAAFREIRNVLLAVGLGMVLLAFPVSFLMGRRVARPLEQLTKGALAIREDHLDVRLPEGRRDEVGALARAFRGMVDELREKKALEDLLGEMRRRSPAETGSGQEQAPLTATNGEAPAIAVGTTFAGRYQIVRPLGQGGMGLVYQANDVELDDAVALKVLTPKAFAQGERAVKLLKQEIRLARRITHPNVVRVHDLGEAQSIRFISMEYVPGTTLKALLKRRGALDMRPGLQVSKQLCRGLTAIHAAGIVHRDIKPDNVMVLPNGMLKLMDFGIAELLKQGDDGRRAELVAGTPQYMSPEQFQGKPLDGRSDIYAMGVLMYETFTGVLPFTGKTLTELVTKSINQPPENPVKHRGDLPGPLQDLILRCLEKEPARRPADAKALYTELVKISTEGAEA